MNETRMLMAGNVGVNRVRFNCLGFKNILTVQQMVFQSPDGFEATTKPYFYQRVLVNKTMHLQEE